MIFFRTKITGAVQTYFMSVKDGISNQAAKRLQKAFHQSAKPPPLNASKAQPFDHKKAATMKTIGQNFTVVI